VRRATGRSRDDWFARLDKWGAASREHKVIAAWLMREHDIENWWAQTLTVDYERLRGLRPPGGGRDGTYSVNASKTVGVSVERLFEHFVDGGLRKRWLPGAVMSLRTSQPQRTARFDWGDGATRVCVWFTAKGKARSHAALLHERLPSARAAKKARLYWLERMNALKTLLEARS